MSLRTVVWIIAPDDAEDRLAAVMADRLVPYGGREIRDAESYAASFDTPADAVHFAVAVRGLADSLGIQITAGLDHGAFGRGNSDPHVVAAAAALYAAPGEILLTDIVCRLAGQVPGSHYVDRGRLRLPGLDDRQQLHELASGAARLRAQPVLGRDLEVDMIRAMLRDVVHGRGRVLLVEGAAGIGKSHLARAAGAQASSVGVHVVSGAADELRRDRPAELLSTVAAVLGVRENELGVGGGHGHRGGDPAFSVTERFLDAVNRAATQTPLLVIAEDAHWADGLSLRALTALVRAAPPLPVGVLVTFRPQPRPTGLLRCFEAADAVRGEMLRLASLDDGTCADLVTARTGAVAGPRLRQLLEGADGNPLFVIELLHALEEEGALRIEQGVVDVSGGEATLSRNETAGRPVARAGLVATINRRLAGLPDATRDLLRLASLLGTSFTLEDLATIASGRIVDVASDLMPALASDIVIGDRDRLSFHHDLVREAVYDSVPEAVRRDLHSAAGRALAAAGAPAATVADQFSAGGRVNDRLAIEWLERAAEEALAFDTRAAVDRYEQALGLLPEADRATRDRLEAVLVELLAWSGRMDDAKDLASRLLARSLSADDERAARRALASTLAVGGDLQAAAEQCERALETDPNDAEADVLRCAAAGMSIIAGSGTEEAIDVATDIATRDQRAPACWAEQTLGIAALAEGRYRDAHRHFHRSRTLLDSGFVPPLGFLIPHAWEAAALSYLDRNDDFEQRMQMTRTRATARGDVGLLIHAHAALGFVHYLTGSWDDVGADIGALVGIGEETGATAHRLLAHALSAAIALDRGVQEDAQPQLEQGRALIESGTAHLVGSELLAWTAARFLVVRGDLVSARSVLEVLWEQMAPVAYLLQFELVLPMLVALRRQSGDAAGAGELTGVVARAADRCDVPIYRAAALRCRGLADGDPDPIVEAASLSRTSSRRLSHAGLLEDGARALLVAGRVAEASSMLEEAVSVLQAMGAVGWIRRLDDLARTAGLSTRPSPPRAMHGWESLSRKEHEVVSLVTGGLSNPEIGERLFISRRTVESHLSHIFRKLGLSNRTQLALAGLERDR